MRQKFLAAGIVVALVSLAVVGAYASNDQIGPLATDQLVVDTTTATATDTATATQTAAGVATDTPTVTDTPTATSTAATTDTPTATATPSTTGTPSATDTPPATDTPVPSATACSGGDNGNHNGSDRKGDNGLHLGDLQCKKNPGRAQ
jgi:hypothetical protein